MRSDHLIASLIALLVLAACGEDQQSSARSALTSRRPQPNIEFAPPRFQRPLIAPDGTHLNPKDVIEDGARLLVLSAKPEELWALSTSAPHNLQRISEPRQFGQASVRALAAHSAGISFLGVDGRLRVMQRDDPAQLAHTIQAYATMRRPFALGEWFDGRWIAAHSAMAVHAADAFTDSVVVTTLDSAGQVSPVYAFERAGPTRPDVLIADYVGGRALRDQVVLVGNEPVRVIVIRASSVRIDTLLDAPTRPFAEDELAQLRRTYGNAQMPQFAREARLPAHQPAATAALPFVGGYLVVAASGDEQFAADLYCGRQFRRTVLSRTTISGMYVTQNGLVVIDEPDDAPLEAPARLSYYRAADLTSECTK